MPHSLRCDESSIAFLKIRGNLTLMDMEEVLEVVNSEHGGKSHPYLLCDLRDSPGIVPDKAARQALRKLKGSLRWQNRIRDGYCGAYGSKDYILERRQFARFFKTEEEALCWLKE